MRTGLRGHGSDSWEGGLERRVVTSAAAIFPAMIESSDSPTSLYDPRAAIATVAATDLVALIPRRLAEEAARQHRIVVVDSEAGAAGEPDVDMAMLWHTRRTGDAGLVWLRELVVGCVG